jgi:hypothetical protein
MFDIYFRVILTNPYIRTYTHTYKPIEVLMLINTASTEANDNHNANEWKVRIPREFTPVRYVPHILTALSLFKMKYILNKTDRTSNTTRCKNGKYFCIFLNIYPTKNVWYKSCKAQFVATLCYRPKSRGSEPRWGHWDFHGLNNPFGHTMVLGSTHPLIEISSRDIFLG